MAGAVWRESGSADTELCSARTIQRDDDELLCLLDALYARAAGFADGPPWILTPRMGTDGAI